MVMGIGISAVLGMLRPTLRPGRTIRSMVNHALCLLGAGLALAWVMYLLPRSQVRF